MSLMSLMSKRAFPGIPAPARVCGDDGLLPLGSLRKGERGVVAAIREGVSHVAEDLLTRILEMGFIEGASVVLLHEGPIGRDPIAVMIRDTMVALRRREADAIMVKITA